MQEGRKQASFSQKREVHIIAQSNKAGMDVMQSDVSGLLSMALCQTGSGTLATLRSTLGDLLVEELKVSYEMPPGGAIAEHRSAILGLFLPMPHEKAGGAGSVLLIQRRCVLACLFNGDLSEDEVIHFCPYGCCKDWADTELRFRVLAPWALLPHKAPRYARHKWTNHSAAVDWAGILSNFHGLLARLMNRWCGSPSHHPGRRASALVDSESAGFLPEDDKPMAAAEPEEEDEQEAALVNLDPAPVEEAATFLAVLAQFLLWRPLTLMRLIKLLSLRLLRP